MFRRETDSDLGGEFGSLLPLPVRRIETPADYFRRIIAEKGLSHVKVAQRAKQLGGDLSPGWVNQVIQGLIKSPSIDKIKDAALGLGEPEDDVDAVFRGKTLADESSFSKSAFALLYHECAALDEADRKEVKVLLDAIKRDIQRRTLKS